MKKLLFGALLFVAFAVAMPVFLASQTNTGWFLPMEQVYVDPTHDSTEAVAIGDVNGDGRADLVVLAELWGGSYTYKLFVYTQNSSGILNLPVTYDVHLDWAAGMNGRIAIGDVNNDGRNDIVVPAKRGLPCIFKIVAEPSMLRFIINARSVVRLISLKIPLSAISITMALMM